VIGHQLTHGFDDQGSEINEKGMLEKLQTPDEQVAFKKLAQNIVDQANNFEVLPGTFLQGELILGEAIADVGGLALANEALKLSENLEGNLEGSLEELFIGFAICERGHTTEQRAIELAKTDPHPPSRFRVNCVVPHVDDFYEHFGVTPSDKLYLPPEKRARIW
jgi:predicted metalloendopeptidase